jgi:hypothetical protein
LCSIKRRNRLFCLLMLHRYQSVCCSFYIEGRLKNTQFYHLWKNVWFASFCSLDYEIASYPLSLILQGTREALPNNKMKTTFEKSVPMSTYLVCFAVHQFHHVERISAKGVPVSLSLFFHTPCNAKCETDQKCFRGQIIKGLHHVG